MEISMSFDRYRCTYQFLTSTLMECNHNWFCVELLFPLLLLLCSSVSFFFVWLVRLCLWIISRPGIHYNRIYCWKSICSWELKYALFFHFFLPRTYTKWSFVTIFVAQWMNSTICLYLDWYNRLFRVIINDVLAWR